MDESELREKLGERIRSLRQGLYITQLSLARAVDIASPSHLCDIEAGRKTPSIELLHKLELTLGPIWQPITKRKRR